MLCIKYLLNTMLSIKFELVKCVLLCTAESISKLYHTFYLGIPGNPGKKIDLVEKMKILQYCIEITAQKNSFDVE